MSEKATKINKIFSVKWTVNISSIFVAFLENKNFKTWYLHVIYCDSNNFSYFFHTMLVAKGSMVVGTGGQGGSPLIFLGGSILCPSPPASHPPSRFSYLPTVLFILRLICEGCRHHDVISSNLTKIIWQKGSKSIIFSDFDLYLFM